MVRCGVVWCGVVPSRHTPHCVRKPTARHHTVPPPPFVEEVIVVLLVVGMIIIIVIVFMISIVGLHCSSREPVMAVIRGR